ncbi:MULTISPECIES: flagellar brake protein [unclassified Variovorax]|uniref:flagellar brake protein n=1 Tax=unclassified Variovorax TaxID=663243 RepID=UPI003F481C99
MENQSNGQADAPGQTHTAPDESADEFGRRNPMEIGARLRNLVNGSDFLTVQHARGQLVTQLLDVDVRARTFTFDWGASAEQNQGLLTAQRCQFSAQPEGVRIEFATASPRESRFEGLPAFEADFPEVLFYLQRREYFRVETPLDSFTCTGRWPKGDAFRFEVNDLSLGGVGMRTMDERITNLSIGTFLRNCELSLGTLGKLSIDLELVSRRHTTLPNGKLRYQLGFRFMALPGSVEGRLQKLINQLEMKRNAMVR